MGIFSSPDPPEPPPVKPDPEPPKKNPDKKKSEGSKEAQEKGVEARRKAQRRGRSNTILTAQDEDQGALGKSRGSGRNRKTKLGSA